MSKTEDVKFYYDQALDFLAKANHTKAGEYVKDVLVENCEAEKEWHSGLTSFLTFIQQNGLEIEAPTKWMQEVGSKLFEIRFLMKMIHASGLGKYEEQILNYEIERRWKPGSGQQGNK
jgi:hypothetical protein